MLQTKQFIQWAVVERETELMVNRWTGHVSIYGGVTVQGVERGTCLGTSTPGRATRAKDVREGSEKEARGQLQSE